MRKIAIANRRVDLIKNSLSFDYGDRVLVCTLPRNALPKRYDSVNKFVNNFE